jgi:prophage antirepressor-like protein
MNILFTKGKNMEKNNALQIFNYEGDDIRTVIDERGSPWFAITDVCRVLEIANVGNATSRLDKDGVRLADTVDALGKKQEVNFANEPNLYRLIFRSDKPEAKVFQDWVYNDVLPAIRKTGSYSTKERSLADIQAVIRVTAGQYTIELLQFEGDYRIDSRQIAPNLGLSHGKFLEEIREFANCFEYFGLLKFQEDGEQTYALLNSNQARFALSLMQDTGQIIYWKMALLDALDQLEKRYPTKGRITTWQLIGETKISKVSLTNNEREVIAVLRKEGRPLSAQEIAHALPAPVATGTMVGRLRHMERLSFVESTPDGRFIPLFW